MTKDHIIDIARGLKDRCENNSISALQIINKTLVDDLTVQSAARQDILQAVSGTTLLDLCKEQFCALYISCNTGLQKDRYALLQIRFCEWISQCLICGTPENMACIPESVSLRNTAEHESQDISVVLHAFGTAFFQLMSEYIRDMRPKSNQSPVLCHVILKSTDSTDAILGFAGACLRIVFKKSDDTTRLLIKNLQMTKQMKSAYCSFGVLSPGASQQPTIPVRPLNKYLTLLTRSLKESCREESLLLYKHKFVRISILFKSS